MVNKICSANCVNLIRRIKLHEEIHLLVLFFGACSARGPKVNTADTCTYQRGCYCQPVGDRGSWGINVDSQGEAVYGSAICLPSEDDLKQDGTFCLPVKGEVYGFEVVLGRVVSGPDGEPARCEVQ